MTGGGDDGIIRLPKESEHVITRLEDICGLPDGGIVIADHANGILIYDVDGKPVKHLNGAKVCLILSRKSYLKSSDTKNK